MGLLDGELAGVFAAAFGPIYLDGSLYRANITNDGQGGGTESFADPEAVKVQIEAATQAMRAAEGYVDTDMRILMLADGVARPSTDDEVEARGVRWAIANVGTDPASAYWDLHGRLSGNAAGS